MAPFSADTSNVHGSEVPSWDSGGTAGILPAERAKASFDVEKMTNFIDGGKKETFRRRWITGSTEEVEDMGGKSERFDMPREGDRGAIAENFKHFMDVHKKHLDRFMVPKGRDMLYMTMGQTMGGYPGFGLFITTVIGQSSPEQLGWWLGKTYGMQITGAYAQTELGHGSNVRGLQTTAHYDVEKHEFVLNTPTLDSMKWWPSSMATATHAVVYAQLIIKGKEYGVHVFMVQLRDENLEPLEGIEVGDIGTKAGENEVDIGYLRMKNVRVPRKHMFEKKSHVEPDGTYVKHSSGNGGADDKTHYLTMMTARVALVAGASVFLAKGATIAIRYNAVRKQGFKNTQAGQSFKGEENQIIDYKMNQYILLKELSLAFAIRITSNWLSDKLEAIQQDPEAMGGEIPELHASAAGLKGFCCNAAAIGLEELRKCCGGAGYLLASGIAPLEADYKWRATAEGDTTVMLLQTARYLMKAAAAAVAGNPLPGSLASALSPLKDPNFDAFKTRPRLSTSWKEYTDLDFLLKLFEFRTLAQIQFLRKALDSRLNAGQKYDEAWAELTLKACRTGQSHVMFFMLGKFIEMVRSCEDQECQKVLTNVCVLFALQDIIDGKQWGGLLGIEELDHAEEACNKVCSMLRPNAVALVDAWDFHDKTLNSTIGRYDGNVYEAQYLAAVKSPLNKDSVPAYFDIYKQYLDLDFLKLRNGLCDEDLDPDDCSAYPEPEEKSVSAKL
mmetsp:Transcript_2951/g.3488  ORF Transcript_2951/g.3488 Transcript_2951/m.3488 type:complete len:727 (-) Transcript_2951:2991-5171(-)|eukprot:CAMPEP_0184012970 /NCGR_PEP_ID=MMETSP0954-20121128/4746_1 /TAXON_ID=627963 /ORGANISM="Aplanochytrium sp, Strain PBS07" /LENGTH=726 /DNA_ID=CAMNT_0026293093 /DNA_START=11 /DNA_END=2191 /DNA_ORIENTATION=-